MNCKLQLKFGELQSLNAKSTVIYFKDTAKKKS